MFHSTPFQQFLNDFICPTASQPSCVVVTDIHLKQNFPQIPLQDLWNLE